MTAEQLEQLVATMRRLGVAKLRDDLVEVELGPEPVGTGEMVVPVDPLTALRAELDVRYAHVGGAGHLTDDELERMLRR